MPSFPAPRRRAGIFRRSPRIPCHRIPFPLPNRPLISITLSSDEFVTQLGLFPRPTHPQFWTHSALNGGINLPVELQIWVDENMPEVAEALDLQELSFESILDEAQQMMRKSGMDQRLRDERQAAMREARDAAFQGITEGGVDRAREAATERIDTMRHEAMLKMEDVRRDAERTATEAAQATSKASSRAAAGIGGFSGRRTRCPTARQSRLSTR